MLVKCSVFQRQIRSDIEEHEITDQEQNINPAINMSNVISFLPVKVNRNLSDSGCLPAIKFNLVKNEQEKSCEYWIYPKGNENVRDYDYDQLFECDRFRSSPAGYV